MRHPRFVFSPHFQKRSHYLFSSLTVIGITQHEARHFWESQDGVIADDKQTQRRFKDEDDNEPTAAKPPPATISTSTFA